MSWSVDPFKSVGPLVFGDSRQVARTKLGYDYDSFEKRAGAIPTDAYDTLGVHLYFDGDDLLELVELFEPASTEVNGVSLMGRVCSKLLIEFGKLGIHGTPSDVGYVFDSLGVAITVSDHLIEGVAVFRKGYYG